MQKTIDLGKVDYEGRGYKANLVTITIELRDGRLAMSGDIWDARHSDIVGGGQNYDDIARLFPSAPKVQRMIEVWKRWHINTMRAGCEHQRAEGWDTRPIDPSKPLNAFGKHFEGQRDDLPNMLAWVRPSEHPEGLLTKPCPTCGYRYGTQWLPEPLPDDIVAEVTGWLTDCDS